MRHFNFNPKRPWSILLIFLFTASGYSQNITDIVRWSQIQPFSTGRSAGVSGAFGAMGGDLSSVSINPAGIGDYRVSEFVITPSIINNGSDAYFIASSNPNNSKSAGLNIASLGFVASGSPNSSLTSSNFAITLNNTSTFRKKYFLEGTTPGSITTYFAEQANTHSVDELDDFISYPAYNTGAIFDFDDDMEYNTDFEDPSSPVRKSQDVSQKGGAYDLSLTWAGEVNHKLNFGLGVSMPIGSFEEVKVYQETDPNNSNPVFESLEYSEFLNTSSIGFNAKAGFLYKEGFIRFGGAIHSPTFYYLKDDYYTTLTYSYLYEDDVQTNSYNSADGTYDYKIRTPWKAIGSIGATIRSGDIVAFVDLDIEYKDYTSAHYKGNDSYDIGNTEINQDIKRKLDNVVNYRLGGEIGYNHFRGRAGVGIENSPFNADEFYKPNFSFGLGYRGDRFYTDLGVYVHNYTEGYNPYVVTNSALDPLANIENRKITSALTFGFKF
ncbi:MAG: hypothetical protein R2774_02005 [Saprospiraceae bacterium]